MTNTSPISVRGSHPSPGLIGEALRSAFMTVICDLPETPAERSQKWVVCLGHLLAQLKPWDSAHLLHKTWGRQKRALDYGEFVTDIAIVEKVNTAGIRTRSGSLQKVKHQPEYVRRMLLAVESEFETNSQHQLDDLSKLLVVNAPVRIFVASRAGNGIQSKLEPAQLRLFADVISDVQGEIFMIALMPHPRHWRAGMQVKEISVFLYSAGDWATC